MKFTQKMLLWLLLCISTATGLAASPPPVGPNQIIKVASPNHILAVVGDSITAQGTTNAAPLFYNRAYGYSSWLKFLTNNTYSFPLANNFGVAGDTTTMILARMGPILASGATTVVVHAGTNDVVAGNFTYATTIANLQNIYSQLRSAGMRVIAIPIIPRSYDSSIGGGVLTLANRHKIERINEWIRLYCIATPGMFLADPTQNIVDVTASGANIGDPIGGTTAAATAYLLDGLHPAILGAYYMGLAAANVANTLVPQLNTVFRSPSDTYSNDAKGTSCTISGTTLTVGGTLTGGFGVGQALDGAGIAPGTTITALGTGTGGAGTYTISVAHTIASPITVVGSFNDNGNFLTNGMLSGNTGSLTGSAGGTVATSWTLQAQSGGAAVQGSQGTITVANGTTYTTQIITLSAAAQGKLFQQLFNPIGLAVGDTIYLEAELTVASGVNIIQCQLEVNDGTNSAIDLRDNTTNYYPAAFTGVLRTPNMVVTSTATITSDFNIKVATSGSGTFTISRIALRKVSP